MLHKKKLYSYIKYDGTVQPNIEKQKLMITNDSLSLPTELDWPCLWQICPVYCWQQGWF